MNYVKIIAGIVVVGMVVGFWWSYDRLLQERDRLAEQVGAMEAALAVQKDTIAAQGDALTRWQEAAQEAQRVAEEQAEIARGARGEIAALRRRFAEKPVRRQINEDPDSVGADIDRLHLMLMCASGSGSPDCPSRNTGAGETETPEASSD